MMAEVVLEFDLLRFFLVGVADDELVRRMRSSGCEGGEGLSLEKALARGETALGDVVPERGVRGSSDTELE